MITDKDRYYIEIAKAVGDRATCIRAKVGAIIVKNDQIVSTGFAGAPRKRLECSQIGKCYRVENKLPHGADYAFCRSVHAEMNAIIHAGRDRTLGATLYLAAHIPPCYMCARMIINAGIERIVLFTDDSDEIREMTPDELEYQPQEVVDWIVKITNG